MTPFDRHTRSFDRKFNFIFWMIMTVAAIIFTFIVAVYGSIGYIAYKTYQDPSLIGKTAGEIVREYESTKTK